MIYDIYICVCLSKMLGLLSLWCKDPPGDSVYQPLIFLSDPSHQYCTQQGTRRDPDGRNLSGKIIPSGKNSHETHQLEYIPFYTSTETNLGKPYLPVHDMYQTLSSEMWKLAEMSALLAWWKPCPHTFSLENSGSLKHHPASLGTCRAR